MSTTSSAPTPESQAPVTVDPSLVERIDAVLPQTQCTQCGYDGCRPYAAAIAAGTADIDQCPPGGDRGVHRLANVTGRRPIPLNPVHGPTKPLALAVIDEAACIGCTLCIKACPVDAIVGAAKRMHDVVADLCTGCELCIPPCPVDCIVMIPAHFDWDDAHADAARERHRARDRRLARIAVERRREAPEVAPSSASPSIDRRQRLIDAAVARARQRAAGKRAS